MVQQKIHIVLHNIRSRENVGSIFRTADAVGVGRIYLCGITPTPPHEKISKTALGAEAYVPWEYCKQTWRLINQLKKDGFQVVALEKVNGARNIFKFKSNKNIALVIGNEVSGLSPEILKRADVVLSIPMRGKKESLNVAVAFGIAAYQLIK